MLYKIVQRVLKYYQGLSRVIRMFKILLSDTFWIIVVIFGIELFAGHHFLWLLKQLWGYFLQKQYEKLDLSETFNTVIEKSFVLSINSSFSSKKTTE